MNLLLDLLLHKKTHYFHHKKIWVAINFSKQWILICKIKIVIFNKIIEPKANNFKNEIFVKKWVDYSSKYGLGYLLSNGSTGVFFNDSTKIVSHPKNKYNNI